MSVDIEEIIKSKENIDSLDYDEDLLKELFLHFHKYIEHEEMLCDNENSNNLMVYLKANFQRKLQAFLKQHKIQIKKSILLFYYNKFIGQEVIKENKYLIKLLMKKPANDISGINQITILTSPTPDGQDFSCKHDCFYCPNEPAHEDNNWTPQPRSYLSKEPAVQRANRNKFDPFDQTIDRMNSLLVCGHKCDKLEFILEGGTFTEYPKRYLENYFKMFIYAINTYFDSNPKREPFTMEEEITLNKKAKARIIGICIETRPDAILENDEDGIPWIKTLLSWGVTRLQLGVQQIDNFILKKINRGHTIEKVIEAIEICKNNCFKIDIHLMPDLPYSNMTKDTHMFNAVYSSDKFQPDQIKVYPCEVVPWTKIEKWHKDGKYKPYGEDRDKMDIVLKYAMTQCPPYIRLPRVIRDIPHTYISGGVKCGNLRQIVNDQITKEKSYSMDIRFREIGRHPEYTIDDAELFVREYQASNGTEYFISFESYDNKAIYGFVRLRIPYKHREIGNKDIYEFQYEMLTHPKPFYNETLEDMGLIRELHVYGGVQKVNSQGESMQHKGFGKQMLNKAEEIAYINNLKGVVVISGIGVREYYEKLGYTLENHYMIKKFNIVSFKLKILIITVLILTGIVNLCIYSLL